MITDLSTGNRLYGEDHCPDPSLWFQLQELKKNLKYWEGQERAALGKSIEVYDNAGNNIRDIRNEICMLEGKMRDNQ